MRRALQRPVLLAAALLSLGHVGSPETFFAGRAGPYLVRVAVRPPETIPGAAQIAVRLESPAAARVSVQPARWDAGRQGAPPPEPAAAVRGVPGLYSAQVWLLTPSSYALRIEIAGAAGRGGILIPLAAAPTRRLGMPRAAGALLLALLGLLVTAAAGLVGAGCREATLAPGETPTRRRRRLARAAAGGAALAAAVALAAGRHWWERVDAEQRGRLYRPYELAARVAAGSPRRLLTLDLSDPRWRRQAAHGLVLDHGKLMHLFLLRVPGYDAFAHLHPVAVDDRAFEAALPDLPAGRYRLYADVTDETGFAHTLVGRAEIPAPAAPGVGGPGAGAGSDTDAEPELAPDPDDSWRLAAPLPGLAAPAADAAGLRWVWSGREALAAGEETTLRFRVSDAAGRPVPLEPYLGMWSHAVVARDDGQVFVHLHPSGSISMAAQQLFARRWGEGAASPSHAGGAHQAAPAELTFPYAFPAPGLYRIWVQVKSGGRVATGVFDTRVGAAR